jgi:hypothetical protein
MKTVPPRDTLAGGVIQVRKTILILNVYPAYTGMSRFVLLKVLVAQSSDKMKKEAEPTLRLRLL